MGWPRLVGSSKIQVSFAEYRLSFVGLFCKRNLYFVRRLLIVGTPYRHRNASPTGRLALLRVGASPVSTFFDCVFFFLLQFFCKNFVFAHCHCYGSMPGVIFGLPLFVTTLVLVLLFLLLLWVSSRCKNNFFFWLRCCSFSTFFF